MAEPEIWDLLVAHNKPRAEFAYVDDSGDPGWTGGSRTFGLGCVIVPIDHWTARLDLLTEMRREIRTKYRINMTDELKGQWLSQVRGTLRNKGLGDGQLRDIYERHMKITHLVASRTFAVTLVKDEFSTKVDLHDRAWEFLLQRLRIRSQTTGAPIVLVHDNGSTNEEIRKIMRRFRRFSYGPGGNPVKAELLVEDPVPRDSQHSYFIQLADLCAYAASRKVVAPSGRAAAVCDETMWSKASAWTEVQNSGPRDGIVRWRK